MGLYKQRYEGMLAGSRWNGVTVSYILTRDIHWHTMGMGRTIGEAFFKNMVMVRQTVQVVYICSVNGVIMEDGICL